MVELNFSICKNKKILDLRKLEDLDLVFFNLNHEGNLDLRKLEDLDLVFFNLNHEGN